MASALPASVDDTLALLARGRYVADRSLATALFLALRLRRPLFLEGEAGVLPPERRPGAEYLAWSAVHGLALLVIEGPLGRLAPAQRQDIGQRLLEMVEKGL